MMVNFGSSVKSVVEIRTWRRCGIELHRIREAGGGIWFNGRVRAKKETGLSSGLSE